MLYCHSCDAILWRVTVCIFIWKCNVIYRLKSDQLSWCAVTHSSCYCCRCLLESLRWKFNALAVSLYQVSAYSYIWTYRTDSWLRIYVKRKFRSATLTHSFDRTAVLWGGEAFYLSRWLPHYSLWQGEWWLLWLPGRLWWARCVYPAWSWLLCYTVLFTLHRIQCNS